jgi:RiboL-PSP-HEPN
MAGEFAAICEDFVIELQAIKTVIDAFSNPTAGAPRARVAAVNSATLLLAATLEEFVREMARAYARAVVAERGALNRLPRLMLSTAWKRSLDGLLKLDPEDAEFSRDASDRFSIVQKFFAGDLAQDIYGDLIHNENNMRPKQINELFKLSDLKNICLLVCDKDVLLGVLEETEQVRANGVLVARLEEFFRRRNQVAHSIGVMRSSSPDEVGRDIVLFSSFASALCATLEAAASRP